MSFIDRFHKADKKIVQSIQDGNLARERRERTKTAKGYERWNNAVSNAQDAHTSAWSERHQLVKDWDAHYRATYGAA